MIDIPAVPQEDLALLDGPRVDDSADEGIVDNGALGNKKAGDVGPAVSGSSTYGSIENGACSWGGSLVKGNCRVVAQQQAWQYALHDVKIAEGGSFFHSLNPLASDTEGRNPSHMEREMSSEEWAQN